MCNTIWRYLWEILTITMANARRTVCAANQQSTPHDGVITPSSHEANMPAEGSNTQLQGSDIPPTGANPTQGTTVPPIQETESSLPLTGIPTGNPTTPLTSIQAAIATLLQFSNRYIAATTEQPLQGHGANFPPPTFQPSRINDPSQMPHPPPPRRANNDIPPYGHGPEVGFRDYSGPYTTDIGESSVKTTIPEGIGVHWNERPLRSKNHQSHQSVTFKGNRS